MMGRVSRTSLAIAMIALAVTMFVWASPNAKAGAIPYVGKMIAKGTAVAVAATATGGEAALNKVQSAAGQASCSAGNSVGQALSSVGQAAANGARDGGAVVYYGVKRTPHALANGAKALWHEVW